MSTPTVERPDLPFSVQIEVTSRCNLACEMCPLTIGAASTSLEPGHMSDRVWAEVLAFAKGAGHATVAGFGEPLLHPDCMAWLEQLDACNVPTSLTTNGMAITPRVASRLAGLKNPIRVNVSIDSPDPAVYHDVRRGDLAKAMRGLENVAGALRPDQVSVSSVLMARNLASLADFPPVLARVGVKKFFLQGLVNYNPELDSEELKGQAGAARHVAAIQEACAEHGVHLQFSLPDRLDLELSEPTASDRKYFDRVGEEKATKQCLLPWEMPFVDKDGKVFPCCYASMSRKSVMGVVGDRALTDIWHGMEFRDFRRRLLSGDDVPPICRGCTAAPWGEHPLARYSATLLPEQSRLTGSRDLRLVVRNTGNVAWDQETQLRIGTAHPRGHLSAFYHPSWMSRDRITTFREASVEPGELATFELEVSPARGVPVERFQLLVENQCWLPNTSFDVWPSRVAGRLARTRKRLRGWLGWLRRRRSGGAQEHRASAW